METFFRTKPPLNFLTPGREEMEEVAKNFGLGDFPHDLAADLTHMAAGGNVQPPSAYEKRVWDWTRDRLKEGENLQKKFQSAMAYHRNIGYFLQSIDIQSMPGRSPLEKAMSVLKLLSKKESLPEDEPMNAFQDGAQASPEEVADSIEEAIETAESLDEEEREILGYEDDDQDEAKGDGEQSFASPDLKALKVAEDLMPGQNQRLILDISRMLDEFTSMDLRKTNVEEPDPEGDHIRMRGIRNLSELNRLGSSSWALRAKAPQYFMYKVVTHQLPVKERITIQEKKQCVFILIDVSGSMKGEKHTKATGVVMNRLKAVLSDDAVVYLAPFDGKMGEVWKAENPDEAKQLIEKFRKKNFSGGSTDIPAGVKSAHTYMQEKIEEGEMLYKPEVVVLTDEDSSVSAIKASEIPGTRVHGFAMSVSNKPLVKFCESTGGVGFENF